MPTTLHENRPSAGIGVVEVQKPMVFCDFQHARATLCGDRRGAKTHDSFAISAVPAQPSAGIGVVEVQKLEVFCDFCGARATLCGNRRGRGAKTQSFFASFVVLRSCLVIRACSRAGGSRVRFLPGPRAGVARCNLHFKATCAEQLAQSNLCRPTCADQFAQSALPRATCAEQLAQTNLYRPVCAERLA